MNEPIVEALEAEYATYAEWLQQHVADPLAVLGQQFSAALAGTGRAAAPAISRAAIPVITLVMRVPSGCWLPME